MIDDVSFELLLDKRFRESGFELNKEQIQKFNIYQQELIAWNKKVNLTSITDELEIINKHFLGSIELSLHLDPIKLKGEVKMADVGTGGGFPGLPIKIYLPDIELTLIESSKKKAMFLKSVIRSLGLSGLEVIDRRAEELGGVNEYREKYDLVLSRYVAQLATLVEYSLPLVKVGGLFVAYKYGEFSEELMMADWATRILGGKLLSVEDCKLPLGESKRSLVFISKIEPTPQMYPRVAGSAKKRPLVKKMPTIKKEIWERDRGKRSGKKP